MTSDQELEELYMGFPERIRRGLYADRLDLRSYRNGRVPELHEEVQEAKKSILNKCEDEETKEKVLQYIRRFQNENRYYFRFAR